MIVRGAAAIAACLEGVLGWIPSDDQVSRWSRRGHDPLPVTRLFGRLHGREVALRRWAERQVAESAASAEDASNAD